MTHGTLLLSRKDIEACVSIQEVVATVQQVFRAHGEGQAVLPAKITLNLESRGYQYWSSAMPAAVMTLGAVGMKWVSVLRDNPSRHGLPSVLATILLQDPDTGLLLSVMDGTHITALRTGAAAAVSASYAAAPGANTVAIVGAGTQGRASLAALSHVMPIRLVRVVDAIPSVAAEFSNQMSDRLGTVVEVAPSVEEAVTGADVVVTATTSTNPVVRGEWLKAGVAAISLGSYQEFDDQFILSADRIIVDDLEQCSHRGELANLFREGKITSDQIFGDLGEVAAGHKTARDDAAQRVLVVPIGLGSLDVAVASLAYQKATEMGLGATFFFQ